MSRLRKAFLKGRRESGLALHFQKRHYIMVRTLRQEKRLAQNHNPLPRLSITCFFPLLNYLTSGDIWSNELDPFPHSKKSYPGFHPSGLGFNQGWIRLDEHIIDSQNSHGRQGKFCLQEDGEGRPGLFSLDVAQIFLQENRYFEKSCVWAALSLAYPFTTHLRPSRKKQLKKELLYNQVNCNYYAVLGSQET